VPTLPVVALSLLLIVSVSGCGAAPNSNDKKTADVMRSPTPEEARGALIRLAESDSREQIMSKLAYPELTGWINSTEAQHDLRHDEIRKDRDAIFVGRWTCYLAGRSCSSTYERGRDHYRITGRFEIDERGIWKIVLTGVDHGTIDPKEPKDGDIR